MVMLTKMHEFLKIADFPRVLLHLVNMDMPVRPGILVQRQSKEATAPHLGDNIEFEEGKNRQIFESASVRETNYKVTCVLLLGVI